MAKIEILTPAEQIIFNSPPNFSPDEQNKYFGLPPEVTIWLIQSIYNSVSSLLDRLNLHNDTVKHYATWVRKASLFQINQLQPDKRYLHIICFLVHQYQLRQDIFADILLNCVKSTENAATKNEKEQIFKQKDPQKETLQLLSDARISYKAQLKKIEKLATSPVLSDSEKVQQIRQLLEDYHQHLEIY